jgi:hypothetical protein
MKIKSKLLEFILLAVFWSLFYFLFRYLFSKIGIATGAFLKGFAFTMLCISFTYKKWWSTKSFKSIKRLSLLLFSFILLFGLSYYLFNVYDRSDKLYSYLVSEKRRGWKGKIFEPDPVLGFKTIPDARGLMTFRFGKSIPVAHDHNGFRIPVADSIASKNDTLTDILFLGCSYTYGDACYAENTFPYFVAKEKHMTYKDAGVCSFGLSQMLLSAMNLIPKYKPKYVVVQHSPWLVSRSMKPFAPTYFGSLPNPYFIDNDGNVEIHQPIYLTQMFNLDIERIKKQSGIGFFLTRGIGFYSKEDWLMVSSEIKFILGINKRPMIDGLKAEKFAYSQIYKIAKENNSKMIMLTLYSKDGSTQLKEYFAGTDIVFANADSILKENLRNKPSRTFKQEYANWRMRGKDSVLVDGHPNPEAHYLISKSIIPLIDGN